MAKTTYWTGAVSTDYDTAGNWTNGIPAITDSVYVPASARCSIIPNSSQTLVSLELLDVHEGYRFDIGAPGNPLIIAAKKVNYRGLGTLHFQGSATLATGDKDADASYVFIVDSDNLVDAVRISGDNIDRVLVTKGHVTTSGSAMGWLDISYRDNPLSDAIVVADKPVTIFVMTAGQVTSTAGHAQVHMSGGNYTFSGGAWATMTMAGGKIIYNGTAGPVTILLLGGVLDFRDNPNEITITNLYKHPGAELYLRPNITIQNLYRMSTDR